MFIEFSGFEVSTAVVMKSPLKVNRSSDEHIASIFGVNSLKPSGYYVYHLL
jgi:hypothetical protein